MNNSSISDRDGGANNNATLMRVSPNKKGAQGHSNQGYNSNANNKSGPN